MTPDKAIETPKEEVKPTVTQNIDQAPEPEAQSNGKADTEDVLEVLRPKAEQKRWRFGPEGMEVEYVQKPLSFIAKMQWFSLVGGVLDKAMGGDNPLTVGNLLSGPAIRPDNISANDFRDADTFVHAVGKLVRHAPEFLEDSFCIWLNVPEADRTIIKHYMALPKEEGGLSDEDGLELIERFIDQNYEAIDSFFRDKLSAVQKRVQARSADRQKSRLSKP